tara:strand:+ start:7072 stop:7977 length:906 start_codon:yes stop_codon:yes gene_type:complete
VEILGSITKSNNHNLSQIESLVSQINGQIGIAALNFENDKSIYLNENSTFFMASVFKIPLLITLYKHVDLGKIDMQQRVTLSSDLKTGGSGVLRELNPGIEPTLYDLAMLMIIISDNTATDILYNMIGKDNINSFMKENNLLKTVTPMSCDNLLSSLAGIEPPKKADYQDLARIIDGNYIPPVDCSALDENKSNVSTPFEMVELLKMLTVGNILSKSSTNEVLSILKSQKLKSIIPHYIPKDIQIAHKTGGVYSVRCDVGTVWGPKGAYAVAIMGKDITDEPDIDNKLAKISLSIFEYMTS